MTGNRRNFAHPKSILDTMRPLVMARKGMVSSGHPLATAAGHHVLQNGGTAIDAGVTAGLALHVLLVDRTNFGGVAPIILYHAASKKVVTLDGLGVWPRAANPDYFIKNHSGRIPNGIMQAVTPGAPDAWLTALARFGTKALGDVLEPAWQLAMGAPVSPNVAIRLQRLATSLQEELPSTADYLFPDGRVPRAGDLFCQPNLARVLKAMMDEEAIARRQGVGREAAIFRARDLFYKGWIAEEMVRYHRENSGWLTLADLADHRVEIGAPSRTTYHGYDVYACGPWCQGPVLLQALNMLEQFDLTAMGHNSATYLHLLVEVIDMVFADRENFYGDPRHVKVPLEGLLSKAYARGRASQIQMERATGRMPDPGNPYVHDSSYNGRQSVRPVDISRYQVVDGDVRSDTTYVAAGDSEGNLFSATPSDPLIWAPTIPALGFACSGRGSQSRTDPDHPSCVAPGRRPRLTPNPALVMLGDLPLMGFGCPGGDSQTQGMLQMLLNLIDFDMNPQEAVEAPRANSYNFPNSFAPHPYFPGRVDVESRISESTRSTLRDMGHDLRVDTDWSPSVSGVQLVMINPENGVLLGASDPRREGTAVGW